jgi:hypothetical protein
MLTQQEDQWLRNRNLKGSVLTVMLSLLVTESSTDFAVYVIDNIEAYYGQVNGSNNVACHNTNVCGNNNNQSNYIWEIRMIRSKRIKRATEMMESMHSVTNRARKVKGKAAVSQQTMTQYNIWKKAVERHEEILEREE